MTLNEGLTLLVLVGQLIVFIQQRKLMAEQLRVSSEAGERARKHDRLSVRPILDFVSYSTRMMLTVTVENQGAGAALNVRLEVKVDGKVVCTDTNEPWPIPLLRALNLTNDDLALSIQQGFIPMPTAHLRVGAQMKLIDLHFRADTDVPMLCRRLSFEVRYESIYVSEDEPFVARLNWPSNYATI